MFTFQEYTVAFSVYNLSMVGKYFQITGDGAVHTFSYAIAKFLNVTEPGQGFQGKWVQANPTVASSASPMRVGAVGDGVSSTVGFPLQSGASQFLPPISELSSRYQLNQQVYWLANGDTADCLWGVD